MSMHRQLDCPIQPPMMSTASENETNLTRTDARKMMCLKAVPMAEDTNECKAHCKKWHLKYV